MVESWKKLKTSNLFSSFIVCSNRNRSALVRELLSNNSLFVGQLYDDKSLALRARELIFFTTHLQNCVISVPNRQSLYFQVFVSKFKKLL